MQELPKVWSNLAPLKSDKALTTLDIACLALAHTLRIKRPNITYMVEFLLLGLAFHTEDPDGVSNALNIFMFLDISLEEGEEAAMVAWQWDTALYSNTIKLYTDTTALVTKQKISPIIGWEGAAKMLEQGLVLLNIII